MRIAITGSSGFIGSSLARHITENGHELIQIGRGSIQAPNFQGAAAVIHCAGLAHGRFNAEEHDLVNNRIAVDLADAAAESGVERFVFVSTINVVAGNQGVLRPDMPYAPISAYGEAKANAERTLLMRPEGMEIVVARPPLVFGPGARGNLNSLMRLLDNPLPSPFVENRRSMVSVSNLASSLLFLATTGGKVDRQIYHVTDGVISTATIAYWARIGMGRKPRPLPIAGKPLAALMKLIGKGKMADQLFGDLLIDGTDLIDLGWAPNANVADELTAMGSQFRTEGKAS